MTYMDQKISNIAGFWVMEKKLSYSKTVKIFEDAIRICDCALVNPFKFVKVVKYYYNNYYSDEKQLEYYNQFNEINEKYDSLEKEASDQF